MQGLTDALDAIAGKWIAAEPELGLALTFLPLSQRASQAAFACLQREIEHAAFAIRDNDVAVTKLNWWYEELLRGVAAEAHHPLLQALAADRNLADVAVPLWQAWVLGALAQREREPAADLDAMVSGYLTLHRAAAQVEAGLFGTFDIEIEPAAELAACRHALRDIATCASVIEGGHLPLPLDRMARHQLNRDSLRSDAAPRRQALREQAGALAQRFKAIRRQGPRLGLIRQAGLGADLRRSLAAARADDPSVALAGDLHRLPLLTAWSIWRSALRQRGDRNKLQTR